MGKKYRKSKSLRAGWRKPGIGRYVIGASLIVLGTPAARAGDTITPQQWYEGGTNTYSNWIELSTGGLLTTGYANQAKQGEQLNSGIFGGIADLHYETEVAKKTIFTLDGHSIFDDHDYSVGLGLVRDDLGFVRVHFENFRTWDSGIGGYIPAEQLSYALPGDALALDRGLITFEAGLTKPDLPQITFKYTHWYRNGDESSTLWGPVHDQNQNIYRAYPGIYDIDEKYDMFQLDLTHHYKNVNYGVGVSYQMGELNDANKLTYFDGESVQEKSTQQQNSSYDSFSTHAFAESWVKKNLFLSTGFMYTDLKDTFGGSQVYGEDFGVAYSPIYPALDYGYNSLLGGAHEHQYVMTVNLMSLPTKNFTITPSIRVQKEDWNANSTGTGTLYDPSSSQSYEQPFNSDSGRDWIEVCERLDLRYTGVTNWVFNVGGQWTEDQGNYHENGGLTQVNVQGNEIGPPPVQFATDDSTLFQKYFASARWYPIYRASVDIGGYYKINTYNYNNTQDNTPNDLSTGNAYPGFILYQGFETWDGSIRLTLHLPKNIMLVSRYEYQYSTISTRPDPVSGLSQQDSSKMYTHIIGQNASWTPLNWLGLQAGFNYVLSTTETPATPGSILTQSVLNSQNNYWTVNFNSDFVLDDRTDLNIGYFYYRAADGQNGIVGGLPLGTDTEENSITATLVRRITQNLRLNLKYAYTHYDDFASGGHYDYDAHVIFASLQYRF
jgi:hypothetical protein